MNLEGATGSVLAAGEPELDPDEAPPPAEEGVEELPTELVVEPVEACDVRGGTRSGADAAKSPARGDSSMPELP